MGRWVVDYGLYYFDFILEMGLFLFMLWSGRWKRLTGIWLYIAALLGIDGLARSYALYHYGVQSPEYAYVFYSTDFFLALFAFMLVCSFFRRACLHEAKLWIHLRLLLVAVLVLVAGITAISLWRNYGLLSTWFVVEFEQNLYFTCLVLNTLLYLLMQQIASPDEELELLVCGMGIQFAGPAAGWALLYLTPGTAYAPALQKFIMPACTAGMLLTWFYALALLPKRAEALAKKGKFSLQAQTVTPES
jgi:hypothetical protein